MEYLLSLATESDAERIHSIYAPIVSETAISFELEPPTVEQIRERIRTTLETFPWLVCVEGQRLLGYAYAGRHRTRAAYQWAADVSIYVAPSCRRCGVGRALYNVLLQILRVQGFYSAHAGITLPNPASVGMHEALGFRPVGIYRAVGYKLGVWHDVGWWQLDLLTRVTDPPVPLPIGIIVDSPQWQDILASGLPYIKMEAREELPGKTSV